MASTMTFILTPARNEILEALMKSPDYSKKSKSEILEEALTELAKRHAKSRNPQTTLDEQVVAIPHLYEALENPDKFRRFYKIIPNKEFNRVARAIEALTNIHIKELSKRNG